MNMKRAMQEAQVQIIADSISPQGIRLTTFQLRYWRAIHSELMTHRVFSRNAGSSRARPSVTIIESISKEPWGPLHWGKNQPGMQADEEHFNPVRIPKHLLKSFEVFSKTVLDEDFDSSVEQILFASPAYAWWFSAWLSGQIANEFDKSQYHKQIVNRITEPYNYIDVVLTATDFANWYALRDHKDAAPEIKDLAAKMKQTQAESKPELLQPGDWHLPYILEEDYGSAYKHAKIGRITRDEPSGDEILELLKKASAARCARVSYKLFDGSNANFEADLELFNRLLVSQPLHASPAEHIATPDVDHALGIGKQEWAQPHLHGNFRGFIQFRKTLPNEFIPG